MRADVRHVGKFFGSRLVLRDVSAQVRAGEALLVVGGNGAGKTTLLKIMAGLCLPTAGEVDLRVAPEDCAYLGHATFLYPRLSACANLTFWGRMYGQSPSREDLEAVLERVGLSRVIDEPAGTFSRGMAQRLNLARVFLINPKLVFLDEPGTGLDPASQELLRREIETLKGAGAGVVWVSHHLAADLPFAESVLFLKDAGVAYFGPASGFDPGSNGGLTC
ncbi:MAG: ABC transporter ATP-binding protein [Deltaproteobacteria bacterium HGW-Deltaproteobacteria-8]|nr:MAG: ABC transporter ATP-binding protein [Deltaproteobacteria bacterium HGW-Deltaproteobacteria-8]